MATRRHYEGFIADSGRWDGFAHRAGDIVISTPPKSGTTWMQTLVALLLFDGVPDAPVYALSPWLDMKVRSVRDVHDLLAAQTHRRFIKTHTPLDGLPIDDRVTYITVGRDPRDVLVSMRHHEENLDHRRALELLTAAGTAPSPDVRDGADVDEDPTDGLSFSWFLEAERGNNSGSVHLTHVLHHLGQAWSRRGDPNMHLFHYADLSADLDGELRRLRDLLGVDRDDSRVGELAELATLDAMRARAQATTPEASMGVFRDAGRFFRRGRSGEGAAAMTEAELARYHERVAELVDDPDLRTWVHGGWRALRSDAESAGSQE